MVVNQTATAALTASIDPYFFYNKFFLIMRILSIILLYYINICSHNKNVDCIKTFYYRKILL